MKKSHWRASVILALLVAATSITFFMRRYLGVTIVYSHFFYVPIVLSAYWFGIKGIPTGIYLSFLTLTGGFMEGRGVSGTEDILRALIMISVSLLTSKMSETIKDQSQKLEVSESFYKAILESSGAGIIVSNEDTTIVLVNNQFERLSGLSRSQIEGKLSFKEFFLEEDLETLFRHYHSRREAERDEKIFEAKFVNGDNIVKDVLVNIAPIKGTNKSVMNIEDISPLKELKNERESLSKRLEEALAKVLSGFIPICASCKRIRTETGEWVPVEIYITKRSEAQFSHGICPECKERLYGSYLRGKGT
ncbi:MAG: PAS domain S-box protein [Desulfatiglandales bacterium]